MSELHDRARALIPSLIGTSYGLPADARGWTDRPGEGSVPNNVCTDAADTIAELLAENERLERAVFHETCEVVRAEKRGIERIEEWQAKCLVATARAEAAEARMRELASAEPVACVCAYEGSDGIPFSVFLDPDTARRSPPDIGEPVPLIRRPEMP